MIRPYICDLHHDHGAHALVFTLSMMCQPRSAFRHS